MEWDVTYVGAYILCLIGFTTARLNPEASIIFYAIVLAIAYLIIGVLLHFMRKVFK